MDVLFTSTAGLGHVYPLLPVARALRDAGDDIVFAVPADSVPAVLRQGFVAVPTAAAGSTAGARQALAEIVSASPSASDVVARYFGRELVHAALSATLGAVLELSADLVVSDQYDFAGPLAAAAVGVPHAIVAPSSFTFAGFDPAPLAAELDRHRGRLGLAPTGSDGWLYRGLLATPVPDVLQLPGSTLPASTVRYRHADPDGSTDLAPRWGDGRRPTVYASLGTVAPSMEELREVFRDVLAGLGQLDADVVFTVGDLDRSALGLLPTNVQVVGSLPPRVAMAADLVVTHAGAGTVTAALSRGLPMVTVPLFAEQPHNAARLAERGVAVTVQPADAVRGLPVAVAEVLGDPGYATAAAEVAAEIAATPPAADLVPALRRMAAPRGVERLAS